MKNRPPISDNLLKRFKEIIQEEFINSWLDSPNPAIDNKTPRQMIIENNTDQIETILHRLASGEPS